MLNGDPFKGVIKDVSSSKAGTKYYTLTSINSSQKGQCVPAWSGQTTPDITYMLPEIDALRTGGGDVIVSFGGASAADPNTTAPDLAVSCNTTAELQKAYQSVIDSYHLTHIDFDLEGLSALAPAVRSMRNQAIAALKSGVTGQPLVVSYSMPITPASGLTDDELAVLSDAIKQNVTIGYVNGLAKDYGAPADTTPMGQNAIDATNKLLQQLKLLYPQQTEINLWAMIGLTPMIGVNDPTGGTQREIFTLDDAQKVEQFAVQNKLHELSLWELHRDLSPAGTYQFPATDLTSVAPNMNSGIQQTPYQFSTVFSPFTSTDTTSGSGGQGNGGGNGSTSTCGSATPGDQSWVGTFPAKDISTPDWRKTWGLGSR
ncbi:MAG: hypothetical protein H0U76_15440, partial [Ktedonobacteraceae bacterium]|nr:hypothetical protein [Ktedonobacteraceae bacterium]